MNLLPGVSSHTIATDRLRLRYLESGPADGIPVVLIHGNLASGRFFEHLMPGAPDRYRLIAPDMRGFGNTERVPIDATRGLRDWADDTHSLVQGLGIDRPVHLVGSSTGGAAIAAYAIDRTAASLTFIDPVSPYGFGGVKADGTPCFPDYAGSGGGTGSPEFAQRIAGADRTTGSPFSPRNVMNSSYWSPRHREPADREEILLDEMLKSVTGEDGYPGDFTSSDNWPGFRSRHPRHPERALWQVLRLVGHRLPRPQAADPLDPRHRGHRHLQTALRGRWGRSERRDRFPAGPVRTCSHPSRWSRKSR